MGPISPTIFIKKNINTKSLLDKIKLKKWKKFYHKTDWRNNSLWTWYF